MKEVTRVDLRLVEVMVVKVSWFLKVILNCSVRVSVITVFLVTGVNTLPTILTSFNLMHNCRHAIVTLRLCISDWIRA